MAVTARRWAAAVIFGVVGLGNIVLPEAAQSILGADYLVLCLGAFGLVAGSTVLRNGVDGTSLAILGAWLVLAAVGLRANALGDYAIDKVLGLVIALVLILGPNLVRVDSGFVAALSWVTTALTGGIALGFLAFADGSVVGRATVWGLNPIALARAGTLLALLGTVLVLWPAVARRARAGGLVMIAVGLMMAALTASRGPLLAYAAGAFGLVALLLRARGASWRGFATLGVGGALGTAFVVGTGRLNLERLGSSDSSGRDELWAHTFAVLRAHPDGVGWGQLADHSVGSSFAHDSRLYPHNLLLEVAVEAGVVVALLLALALVALAVRAFVAVRPGSDWSRAVPFVLLVWGAVNSMVSSDIIGNRGLWLGVGLCLVVVGADRRRAARTRDSILSFRVTA